MKTTIFKYIFKMQLKAMLFVSFFMFCLIFLFDFAEVTRKYPISDLQQILFATKLSLLRAPNTFCEILHYMYFITATFSLWHLCSSNQMTILKSSGRSPQQILRPFLTFALCMASLWLFVLHPYGNHTEVEYGKIVHSQSQEANGNIWVDYPKNNQLIFLEKISKTDIDGLYIFDTAKNQRIFAQKATVSIDEWDLKDITVVDCNTNKTRHEDAMVLRNNVSNALVDLLKKPPRKHDIYSLQNVYKVQEDDKVGLHLYEFELHKLLANCLYFVLFALIAATICFPISRYRTKTGVVAQVILIAMFLRFANNLMDSLVKTSVIDVVLGAWAVVIIATFVTLCILTWKEI